MAKTFNLTFDGYWIEKYIGDIPNDSGIYLVYCCTFNMTKNTVSTRKLIYIGESNEVSNRIENHEKYIEWKSKLNDEVLCFSFAKIEADRERAEAALIFKHKPECNEEYVDNFPFDTTTVNSTGICRFIHEQFTVTQT